MNLKASAGTILEALNAEDIVASNVAMNAIPVMSAMFRMGIRAKKSKRDPDPPKKS